MIKKRSNFIEQSIEKVVLVIAGIVCAYILYEYVVRSPYKLKYEGRNFGAGQIDIHIEEEAGKLREQLNREPTSKPAYKPRNALFIAKMNNTADFDANVVWPIPSAVDAKIDKKYRIPLVGQVNDVELDYIRAAAYVPKEELTPENAKNESSYEPNAIDLVTVQGSFDPAMLFDNFQQCFAGKELPEEWRDAILAKPIFAAVELQRQRLGANGLWDDWEVIPRAKIDPYKSDFKVIEDIKALPSGGVTVQLFKLREVRMQVSMLQPEPYQIASADDEWLPPLLHKKYLTGQHEKGIQERREAMTAQQNEQAGERDKARLERERKSRDSQGTGGAAGGRIPMERGLPPRGGYIPGGPRESTRNPAAERQRRLESQTFEQPVRAPAKATGEAAINEEMTKISLARKNLTELREPFVFWAYDDTAEPGNSYRYRVRLGVFNPVAGMGQVRAEDAAYDGKVILWSGFSDVTEPVVIPRRFYFFPLNVQEPAKAVEVQVSKYVLGYWYSGQFTVKRGEEIGRVAKVEQTAPDKDKKKDKNKDKEQEKTVTTPETIDYATGAMLVDVVPVNEWAGDKNLQPRQYFDILYSIDGTSIEKIAAKLMYWPEELKTKYNEIKTLEKKPKEAFRAFNSSGAFEGLRITPGGPGLGPGITGDQRMMKMMEMTKPRTGQKQ